MSLSELDFDEEVSAVEDWEPLIGRQPVDKACYSCALRDLTDFRRECNKLTPGILRVSGLDYHLNDFVYVKNGRPTLEIAQICDLMQDEYNNRLKIRMLEKASLEEASFDRANFVSAASTL